MAFRLMRKKLGEGTCHSVALMNALNESVTHAWLLKNSGWLVWLLSYCIGNSLRAYAWNEVYIYDVLNY